MPGDLVQLLEAHVDGTLDTTGLRLAVQGQVCALRASSPDRAGRRALVSRAEAAVAEGRALTFDDRGYATLTLEGHQWSAGRFETPTLEGLRQRCPTASAPGRVRLLVLEGASPATDIGALQATTADALFQVASQFNCLESPGPFLVPVSDYFHDPTQGPRAAISAFPAALLRHYAAPAEGGRFRQTEHRQINLLAEVLGPESCDSGYFTGRGLDADAMIGALVERFIRTRVGVHDAAQVVLGHHWDGPVQGERLIAQVLTSTIAGGSYGGGRLERRAFHEACRHLLRAAYFGTILAAIHLRRRRVVLTLIGGGVFGNPHPIILESIAWALDQVRPLVTGELWIIVNGYDLSRHMDLHAAAVPMARANGGAVYRFDLDGLVEVLQ